MKLRPLTAYLDLTVADRRRLREVRELVDGELIGGPEDGELALDEISWLAFWAWLQCRDGPVGRTGLGLQPQGCPDVAAALDPIRARALRLGVMQRIWRTHDA